MGPKFDDKTKRTLADRVNSLCSHPDCRAQTKGPRGVDTDKAVNVGEAAHITAANRGAARYDATLTDEQRRDASNGIWMCGVHAKLIDNDAEKFPVELLREWKKNAEERHFST